MTPELKVIKGEIKTVTVTATSASTGTALDNARYTATLTVRASEDSADLFTVTGTRDPVVAGRWSFALTGTHTDRVRGRYYLLLSYDATGPTEKHLVEGVFIVN